MSPRTPEQNQKIRKEKRQIILNAALHVFAEQGYHSASVSSVAKAAKVSKGLMYNYFESKEEVLKTLVYEMADIMMERFPVPDGDPDDAFQAQTYASDPDGRFLHGSLVTGLAANSHGRARTTQGPNGEPSGPSGAGGATATDAPDPDPRHTDSRIGARAGDP